MNNLPKLIVIAGPTASGKTALGVQLGRFFDAEIINADSMQVYRGMDIGTAKPTVEERKGVPHHLLDIVDPDEAFNAALYRSMAHSTAMEIIGRGKLGIVVGGSGLYIKALLGGLFKCAPSAEDLRQSLGREWNTGGASVLYERLKTLDPRAALRIHPHDRVRVVRALEIIQLTGRLPSELGRQHRFAQKAFNTLQFCITVERDDLYRRIDKRTDAMLDAGLLSETERLLNAGYGPNLKPMKAIGYRHMIRYLRGRYSLQEAVTNLKRDTRRYAKRQLTWFRADPEYAWVENRDLDGLVKEIAEFLQKDGGMFLSG